MNNLKNSIELEDSVTDILFHPTNHILFAGLSNGKIVQYNYKNNTINSWKDQHTDSCRHMTIGKDEDSILISVGADGNISWSDTSNGKLIRQIRTGDDALCHTHLLSFTGDNLDSNKIIVTGSDEGCISLWDFRTSSKNEKPLMSFSNHLDYISGLFSRYGNILVSTSGDSTIHTYDLRKGKIKASSNPLDHDILSALLIHQGKYLICGMGDGSINMYKWDYWLEPINRILIHPNEISIDSMVMIDDENIYTGASDGCIRHIKSITRDSEAVVVVDTNIKLESKRFIRDNNLELTVSPLAITKIVSPKVDGNIMFAQGHLDNFVHIWSNPISNNSSDEDIQKKKSKKHNNPCDFKDLD